MIKQILMVFLKEIKCILRDKKSFVFGLLIPLIIAPGMLFLANFAITKNLSSSFEGELVVGINSEENAFAKFLAFQKNIKLIKTDSPEKDLDSGKFSAAVEISEDFDERALKEDFSGIEVKYNQDSISSIIEINMFKFYEQSFKSLIENSYIIDKSDLYEIAENEVALPEETVNSLKNMDTSSVYFNMLVPMLLIVYCCIGSSGTALDLSVGEKERGTLEPLLSTGAKRTAIIPAKMPRCESARAAAVAAKAPE